MRNRFTAYRFEQGCSEIAQNVFWSLYRAGLTPFWAVEAPCKADPRTPRATLINLPKFQADKFKEYLKDHSQP
jgi:hypothetical protein